MKLKSSYFRLVWAILLLPIFYNSCSGFKSAQFDKQGSSSTSSNSFIPLPQKFTCDSPESRAITKNPARRLTKVELRNSVESIFGNNLGPKVDSLLNLYPVEGLVESVDGFNPSYNSTLLNIFSELAFEIPAALMTSNGVKQAFFPACLLKSDFTFNLTNDSCVFEFIQKLGRRIHKRPLNGVETNVYKGILADTDFSSGADKISAVISAMVLNPHFTLHIDYLDTQEGLRSKVDSFTLASKLSFLTSGSPPDDTLLDAAQNGELEDHEKRMSHATRLINTSFAKRFIREKFRLILRIDGASSPNEQYGSYLGLSAENLVSDLQKETLDFVEYIVFHKRGSFADILKDKSAFPPSMNAAKLLGLNRQSMGPSDPQISNTTAGVFIRPIHMISPEPRTSPIQRGYTFSKTALCLQIPAPDPSLLEIGEKRLEDIDLLNVTARQEAEHVTAPVSCVGCHSHINPPGFIFEKFGAFGERRETEAIFDVNGSLVRELSVDTRTTLNLEGNSIDVTSTDELVDQVVNTTQARACFAQNLFRYTQFTQEDKNDHCHLAALENSIHDDQSIMDLLIRNATSEDLKWVKETN